MATLPPTQDKNMHNEGLPLQPLSSLSGNPQTGVMKCTEDSLIIAGRHFSSRLLVGTGKYKDMAQAAASVRASGAEIITVAVRRVNMAAKGATGIMELLPSSEFTYLPNSAGCYTAQEAVRTLKLARELGGWSLVKLEVIGDADTLYPDTAQTLKAAELLVADGFEVMAYTTSEPLVAKQLEEAGCVAVMPLGAPIGSGMGIEHQDAISEIVQNARIPVLVDAGVGTASDAAIAMELGCAAVLMNTAIAEANNPVLMAEAMRHAVIAGRKAFLAGRMPKRGMASPSSPPL